MEYLTINLRGRVRRVLENGREYLVAPVTSIVPGVLPGSRGPLYYPHEEVGDNPAKWDNIPITHMHPYDPVTGAQLSASAPGVWERQGIGVVRGSSYNGKLRHEAWLDRERLALVNKDLLANLERGVPVEVSTGLYTSNEPAPLGAQYRGRPYTDIARDYRPDHLAILTGGQVGACSLQDGCGLLVNRRREASWEEESIPRVRESSVLPGGQASARELLALVNRYGRRE